MPFNYQSLRDSGPPPDGELPAPREPKSPGATVLWLFVAFVPSLIGLPMVKPMVNGKLPTSLLVPLSLLAVACSLVSAFGLLRKVEPEGKRNLFAVFLAIGLFVLNILIVVFIGCSSALGNLGPT